MKIITKTAGVLLAAAALTGVGAGAAMAAPAAHATTPAAAKVGATHAQVGASSDISRPFKIYNFTNQPMYWTGLTGDQHFTHTPAFGSELLPSQSAEFDVTFIAFTQQWDTITYTSADHTQSAAEIMHVDALSQPSAKAGDTSGPVTICDVGNNDMAIEVNY